MTNGYDFYFKDGSDVLTFPITPSELTIKSDSKNEVVTLIDEGEINIPKSPSLIEVEFEARFPMRQYPYAREYQPFKNYHDKFSELKEKKKSFQFIVVRTTPNNKKLWDTNLTVLLEDFETNESVDEGDDVICTFKLKQYKPFGVKVISTDASGIAKPTNVKKRTETSQTDGGVWYTVKSGDCLWNIAKAFYGDALKWKNIYNANKSAIEADAKKHGKKSSSNGHWIWPGLKLWIPDAKGSATVEKLGSGSGGSSSSSNDKSNSKNTSKINLTVACSNNGGNGTVKVNYKRNGVSVTGYVSSGSKTFTIDAKTPITVSITANKNDTYVQAVNNSKLYVASSAYWKKRKETSKNASTITTTNYHKSIIYTTRSISDSNAGTIICKIIKRPTSTYDGSLWY